jgi:hypothetical protein
MGSFYQSNKRTLASLAAIGGAIGGVAIARKI